MSHAPCTSSWPLTQSTVAARTLDALRRPSSTPPAGQGICAGEWGSWSRAFTSSYHHLAGPSACRRTKSSSVALAELARELAASDSSYALKPVAVGRVREKYTLPKHCGAGSTATGHASTVPYIYGRPCVRVTAHARRVLSFEVRPCVSQFRTIGYSTRTQYSWLKGAASSTDSWRSVSSSPELASRLPAWRWHERCLNNCIR